MSEDAWYYSKAGQQVGPVSRAQLEQLVASAQVSPTDFVWTNGMPNWQPAGQVFTAYVNQPPVAPPVGAPQFNLPPQYGAQPGYGAAPMGYYSATYPPALAYGGFWLRFVAWIVDQMIVLVLYFIGCGCVGGVVGGILGSQGVNPDEIRVRIMNYAPLFNIVGLLVSWLYFAIMESSSRQATLGKAMLGLVVTDMTGQRISFARASGRFFGKIISGLILTIGYIMAAFTERRQALHDMMASTLVMKKQG